MEINYFTHYQVEGTGKQLHLTSSNYDIRQPAVTKYIPKIPINNNGNITIDITKLFFQNDKEVLRCQVEYSFSIPSINRPFVFIEIFDLIKMCIGDIDRIICEAINKNAELPPAYPYILTPAADDVIEKIVKSALEVMPT